MGALIYIGAAAIAGVIAIWAVKARREKDGAAGSGSHTGPQRQNAGDPIVKVFRFNRCPTVYHGGSRAGSGAIDYAASRCPLPNPPFEYHLLSEIRRHFPQTFVEPDGTVIVSTMSVNSSTGRGRTNTPVRIREGGVWRWDVAGTGASIGAMLAVVVTVASIVAGAVGSPAAGAAVAAAGGVLVSQVA